MLPRRPAPAPSATATLPLRYDTDMNPLIISSSSSLPPPARASPQRRRYRQEASDHGGGSSKMSKCVILLTALLVHSSLTSADAFSVSPAVAQCPPLRPCPLLHSSLSSSPSPHAKTTTTTLSSSSSPQIDGEFTPPSAKEKALGVLVLLTVPLAWGTYAPVVKYVYEMDPPVPGFVFSTAYYLIASASLLTLMSISSSSTTITDEEQSDSSSENESMSLPIKGGVELGSYLFLGNCLQVVGLETVPADRAAFLVQLTTIMVPIFQAAFARDILAISLKTWVACFLAFSGVIIMGFDGKDLSLAADLAAADSTTTSSTVTVFAPLTSSLSAVADTFSGGDVLIILAAVAYTMHVVRLGKYAQSTTPLQLAASKASWEAILSLTLISGLVMVHGGALGDTSTVPEFLAKTSGEVTTYLATFGDSLANADTSTLLPAFGACLWTGWVTCAYTIYAQSFGQRRVSPTDANLIYTTQPIFSSLFAFALLGETLGKAGIAGGSLIGVALWLITASSSSDENDEDV